MNDNALRGWGPSAYLALGFVLAVIAAACIGIAIVGETIELLIVIGGVFAAIAQVFVMIGVIAFGVQVGNRESTDHIASLWASE